MSVASVGRLHEVGPDGVQLEPSCLAYGMPAGNHYCGTCGDRLRVTATIPFPESDFLAAARQCVICLHELGGNDHATTTLVCGHVFHAACVDEWLRQEFRCPVCRCVVRENIENEDTPRGMELTPSRHADNIAITCLLLLMLTCAILLHMQYVFMFKMLTLSFLGFLFFLFLMPVVSSYFR